MSLLSTFASVLTTETIWRRLSLGKDKVTDGIGPIDSFLRGVLYHCEMLKGNGGVRVTVSSLSAGSTTAGLEWAKRRAYGHCKRLTFI
jgi:hypothetical protein